MPEVIKVKVTIQSQQLSKEDLWALIQAIRDCEQKSFPPIMSGLFLELHGLEGKEAKFER